MYIRGSKIVLVSAVAFFATLVAFNNLTDYGSNYLFVSHVLSMDTTFADNDGRWRAITSPWLHHAAYLLITATECSVAFLCWLGAFRLYRSRNDAGQFNRNKGLAVCGLTLGIILWFTGFITIGGEWFLMWQSSIWNGQQAAFRLAVVIGISLVYLVIPDQDDDA